MINYKFETKLLSSVVHTEETSGNVANIFRDKILVKDKIHHIPAVHGNSIRGILRRVAMNRLCELVDLDKNSISEEMYHILFNGGALTASTGYLELKEKALVRDTLPILSIFGSAMGNDMLQGKMIVSTALPECKELGTGETSYNDMTNIVRYTRQMFYDIEVMNQGVILDWEIILDYVNELEIQALNDTLIQFTKKPYIGGASNKGHGKIEFEFNKPNNEYIDFVKDNKEEIIKFILKQENVIHPQEKLL
jgi:CRISPR/Cas system CSM-associated protein Csm3 (group 7 of RAMP superfamily)